MAAMRPVAARCWAALILAFVLMPSSSQASPRMDLRQQDGIKYGYRVSGDDEVLRISSKKLPRLLSGRTEVVSYPMPGVAGDPITCIEVTVPKGQSWNQHTVKILDGGIGQRHAKVEIHSPPLHYLDYTVVIYGEKEAKLLNARYGYDYNQYYLRGNDQNNNTDPNNVLSLQDPGMNSHNQENPREKAENETSVGNQETVNGKDEMFLPVGNTNNNFESGSDSGKSSTDKQDGSDHDKGADKQDGSDHGKGIDNAKVVNIGDIEKLGKTTVEGGETKLAYDGSDSNIDTNPVTDLKYGSNDDDQSDSTTKDYGDLYLMLKRSLLFGPVSMKRFQK